MTKRQFFSLEQDFPEDWENTPETVKRWVESLIADRLADNESQFIRRELARQISENTLLKSESRYLQVIQSQTDLILRSLPDTTITFANYALCLALGRTADEVLGMKWSRFVPPEELETLCQKIAALTPEAPTFENVNQDYRAEGQIGWTQWISLGIFDSQGQLVEIQSVGRDITELKEKILREQALNRVLQAIRNSLDLDTIFATATAETAQLFGKMDCYVVRYLPELSLWRYVAEFHHHPNTPSRLGFEISDINNSLTAQMKQFQRVRVADTSQINDSANREIAQAIPGAWLLIPLVVEETLWGCFGVTTSQSPFPWHENQVELAQFVADQLAIAIQQANLYRQVQLELEERCRVEAALRESEARFQNMAANVPGAIFRYLLRPDGTDGVLYMSPGCARLWEVDAEAVIVNVSILWQMIHPEDFPAVYQSVMESARTLQPWEHAWRIRTPSGQEKWLEAAGRPIQQSNGDVLWDTLILDVSDRKQAEASMRESEMRYRLLAENMNDLVCLYDLQGRFLYVSPSCETLLGYRYEEMLGQDPYSFFHPDDRDRIRQESHITAISGKPVPITYRMRQKSGNYIWFETLTRPILNATGEVIQLQTTSRDVTERVRVQQQLKHDALHDSLTGLPNRHLLMERLELAIHRAHRLDGYHFAVLFLDLDRFKVVNDSLGHLAGDQLLIAIAQKLQATLRNIDLATRLGGDEFVILLEDVNDIQEAVCATERIFAALQTPLMLEGREVYTTCSIGIVLGTKAYTQAAHLLRDADIAMYRAKHQGKARYEIFDAKMHTQALRRLHLENDLRRAIEQQEFVLHYQPIVMLDTGNLVGFEALIRWQHRTQGLKFPGDFIAVAEETGLIPRLDYWALWAACHQIAAWQTDFPEYANLKISVNLSAQDLRQSNLLEEVDRILSETRLSGRYLALEITESMLIEDIEFTIDLLRQLQEREVQISIDDFGTGYSSLNYLHRLPVDYLKVDRSFVQQIQGDTRKHQIVETIAALSQQLELDAIAEGIETPQQLERLRALGYKLGQGYLFSQALSREGVELGLGNREWSIEEW
jgi:diguanylate cyclase (GGDEF)-like protein/PAS domain S-box-containing protein